MSLMQSMATAIMYCNPGMSQERGGLNKERESRERGVEQREGVKREGG